ncbi:MAG: DUF4333 domain-containing protein [Deltaproteobacteria bacterium]|nr:DUF4333 domain-containing protein [Deltaproteobacteria bacterium]MDQ3301003.1 DUF4333 domain-containing protein [Myxococcota bacterium]
MMDRRIAAVLLALVAVGCKTKIDANKAQDLIKKMLAEKGIEVTPACPDGLEAKSGAKFQCTAIDQTGEQLTIDVTILDDKGTVSAVLVGTIVDTEALLPDIKAKIGSDDVKLTCVRKVIVVTQAKPATCDVVHQGETRKIEIMETDPEKHLINWRIPGADGTMPDLPPPPADGVAPPLSPATGATPAAPATP